MEQAHQLLTRYPSTWQQLAAGTIGAWHCRTLLEATHRLDDATAAQVEARVLPRAATQTPAEYRATRAEIRWQSPTGRPDGA